MTFDRLAYIDRLKAAGVTEPQARAMGEEVATKSDIVALRNELRGELAVLKSDFGMLRSDFGVLKGDFVALKGDFGGLKGELLAAMKADKIDFLKWIVMLIVGQTAVFTALKFLGR